jgi:beta-lactamase superfamily II metal-dependent hydrolase
MIRPSLAILDVGHGNAAVLFNTRGVVVIDGGRNGVLIDFLRQQKVKTVHALLISHADADHISNASDVLLDDDIDVKAIYYNSDASQPSRAWEAFRKAIKEARRNKETHAESQLTTTQTGRLNYGAVKIEVLYPYPETAASGPGGSDEEGQPISSNSMSAVIRLSSDKGNLVMLPGDVEPGCLTAWEEEGQDPTASVLVYPHHGGNPGQHDRVQFAVDLVTAVKPKIVIFSIHRTQHGLPQPDVVAAVRSRVSGVRVVCTQLSAHCAASTPTTAPGHLGTYEANGRASNTCCAGTIIIDLSGDKPVLAPDTRSHRAFIRKLGRQPLCLL